MSAVACARAATDLTNLVIRLERAGQALVRQSRLPEDDFGGLSGDAYRRHAARSAATVAEAGSGLALLAGALAALGRELAAAEEVRDLAAGSPPERARELRLHARDTERQAQDRWRAAVASYDGRFGPGQQPVPAGPVTETATPVVPGGPALRAGGPTSGARGRAGGAGLHGITRRDTEVSDEHR